MLEQYLSKPNGFGMYAQITDEFGEGEQFAPDYAGDPADTQNVVNDIRNNTYQPGPDGLANNDDLGAESLAVHLGDARHVPGEPGPRHLVFASPGFPRKMIRLRTGRTID